tara:strand:- start:1873 stop:2139 length:267 start_codon:yes stop_codon:yes gene_type:complete
MRKGTVKELVIKRSDIITFEGKKGDYYAGEWFISFMYKYKGNEFGSKLYSMFHAVDSKALYNSYLNSFIKHLGIQDEFKGVNLLLINE